MIGIAPLRYASAVLKSQSGTIANPPGNQYFKLQMSVSMIPEEYFLTSAAEFTHECFLANDEIIVQSQCCYLTVGILRIVL